MIRVSLAPQCLSKPRRDLVKARAYVLHALHQLQVKICVNHFALKYRFLARTYFLSSQVVVVSEIRRRRAHIVKPVDGWVSLQTEDGYVIVGPMERSTKYKVRH